MASIITVPQGFGYVPASLVSMLFVLGYQATNVSKARKAANIAYPQAYAEKADAESRKEAMVFNCAQRAHANTLEMLPIVITSTVITALKYPIPAAALCALFSASRILYTINYSTGDPKKRNTRGARVGGISLFALLCGATYVAGSTALAGI